MSDYREVARDNATDEQWEAARKETQECGYVVTPGYSYCRTCRGTGSRDPDAPAAHVDFLLTCTACAGQGEVAVAA
jgi:DnaJ-class molecular chaperone